MELKNGKIPTQITITPEILEETKLTANELLTIGALYNIKFEKFGNIDDFDRLEELGYIIKSNLKTKLTNEGLLLARRMVNVNLNQVFRKTRTIEKKEESNTSIITDEFVKQYRSLFKGTKAGAMGGEKGVKAKLMRFVKEHPDVTTNMIIEATRRYINSLESYRYIQQADYFVYKRDNNSMEETSRLSAFIDEVRSNPNSSDDWTTKLI